MSMVAVDEQKELSALSAEQNIYKTQLSNSNLIVIFRQLVLAERTLVHSGSLISLSRRSVLSHLPGLV